MHQIHQPKIKDFEKIVSLMNEADKKFLEVLTPENAKEIGVSDFNISDLTDNNHLLLAIYEDNEPVGIALYHFKTPKVIWINSLYIHPKKQRQGFGKKLMLAIEKEAKIKGVTAIVLETEKNANWAVNFYNKLDYIILTKEDFQKEPFLNILSKDPVQNRFIFAKKI